MTSNKLTPELMSLLNYVELNETGWCDKAIKQILLATFWLQGQVTDEEDIPRVVHDAFNIDIPAQRLTQQLDALHQEGAIVQQTDNTLSLSYERKNELEATFKSADLIEKETKEIFLGIINDSCADSGEIGHVSAPNRPPQKWLGEWHWVQTV